MAKHMSEYFTIAGRILALSTIILSGLALFAYATWVFSGDGQGSIPVFLLTAPVLIGAFIFFGVTAAILERCGIPIWRVGDRNDREAQDLSTQEAVKRDDRS